MFGPSIESLRRLCLGVLAFQYGSVIVVLGVAMAVAEGSADLRMVILLPCFFLAAGVVAVAIFDASRRFRSG